MNQNEGIEQEQIMNQSEGIEEEQTMTQKEGIEEAKERKRQEILTQDDKIEKLQTTAFQLANFYFIFQGVVFTVISNASSSLKCRDWWFPFTLSFISSVLNLFALLVIAIKYKKSIDIQEENLVDYEVYKLNLSQPRRDQRTSEDNNGNFNTRKQLTADPFTKLQRTVYLYSCMILFIGFSVLTLFGCWWIRCRENDHFNKKIHGGGGGDNNCVKLCDTGKCIRVCPEF
ncbi:hypothetical protein HYC85_009096 [Camellia sinensis]|uniref:Transmembrane protein n=1 Tax=Camellia sinensis TaxID=4442 RepID=A0A7J7HE16_CAMSI|nr:hypothetical protein HYC85_009096 [Camellia sinensis]